MAKHRKPFVLYQKGGTGNWFCAYYINGKRKTQSTLTEDHNEAVQIGIGLCSHVPLVEKAVKQSKLNPLLVDAWAMFQASRSGLSPKTNECYQHSFNAFIRWFGEDKRVSDVTEDIMETFKEYRKAEGKAKMTYHNDVSRMVVFGKWCGKSRQGFQVNLPWKPEDLRLKDCYSPRERYLSKTELEKVLKIAGPKADYVLAYVCTALRRNDLFRITASQIDLQSGIMKVNISKAKNKLHILPIVPRLMKVLKRRMKSLGPSGIVFPKKGFGGTRWPHKLAEMAGIPAFTVHDLRRTCGSLLAQEGISDLIIGQIMMHADLSTTRKAYAHLRTQTLLDALMTLEPSRTQKKKKSLVSG